METTYIQKKTMNKFNLQGANISANTIHIGDTYVYNSPADFIGKNSSDTLSDTEKELVGIIFENTTSEVERQEILNSLKSIRDDNCELDEKKRSLLNFTPLLKTLKTKGKKLAIDLVLKVLDKKIDTETLTDSLKDLF